MKRHQKVFQGSGLLDWDEVYGNKKQTIQEFDELATRRIGGFSSVEECEAHEILAPQHESSSRPSARQTTSPNLLPGSSPRSRPRPWRFTRPTTPSRR